MSEVIVNFFVMKINHEMTETWISESVIFWYRYESVFFGNLQFIYDHIRNEDFSYHGA